jgi:aspartyl/glutamyl-tRNA(Asn/Gln) amidotransferase C subunit
MSIDHETVDHVAWLARLALSDQECGALRGQLSAILRHLNAIAEADTSDGPHPPTAERDGAGHRG